MTNPQPPSGPIGRLLTPLLDRVTSLQRRVNESPTFHWVTVVSSSPLRVRIDGSTSTLDASPDLSAPRPSAGSRVLAMFQNGRWAVVGSDLLANEALGTRNLDDVTAQGQYYQNSNAASTSARNYPTQAAGTLTVEWWGGNPNTVIQTYKSYRGAGAALRGIYWRSTNSTGVWGSWSRLHDSNSTGVVHAEAAGSFSMGSSSNYPVGSSETRSISFPSGRFSVAPLVMVSTAGTFGSGIASAHVITSSGFRADFRRTESQAFSSGVYMWHAIQMSPTSASG